MDCWLSLQLSSTTICQTNGTSSTYSLKKSFSLLFSSLLSSLQRFFFFSMPTFGLKFRLFVRYCMQGMVKIYPTTPFKQASSTRWLRAAQLAASQYDIRGRRGKELGEFSFVKYYYYSIILCLYTHWRENVVMSKEVISSASKLLICSITTTGYGCHMVGHSSYSSYQCCACKCQYTHNTGISSDVQV